jgi:anti-anti-sigma factor
MSIHIEKVEDVERVGIQGDLDFHTITEVRSELAKLADRQPAKVLIDLKNVSYVDSSGLAAFIELFQKMKRYGGKMILSNLTPGVKKIFDVSRLDMILKIAKDEQEAKALL